jgi:hypothetical protein
MNEMRNEFTICMLLRDDTIPAVYFAQLKKIRQKLIDDYKSITYEDTDVLQNIMYSTKPAIYQLLLGNNKDRLAHDTKQHAADNFYEITVTLQVKLRQKFSTKDHSYPRNNTSSFTFEYAFT